MGFTLRFIKYSAKTYSTQDYQFPLQGLGSFYKLNLV